MADDKDRGGGEKRRPDIWERMGVPPADPGRGNVFDEPLKKADKLPPARKRRFYAAACIAVGAAVILSVAFAATYEPGPAEDAASTAAEASGSGSVSGQSGSSGTTSDAAAYYMNAGTLSGYLSDETAQRFEEDFRAFIVNKGYRQSEPVRCYGKSGSKDGKVWWWVSTSTDGQFWKCTLENATGELSYAKSKEPSGVRKALEEQASEAGEKAAEETSKKIAEMEPAKTSKAPQGKLVPTTDQKALAKAGVPKAAAKKLDGACRSYLKSKGVEVPKTLSVVSETVKRTSSGTTTMRVYVPASSQHLAVEAEWHPDSKRFGMGLGRYQG